MQTDLPIWQLHSEILGTLKSGNRLVLVAPTGSGKSTQVPQMLLDAGLLDDAPVGQASPRADAPTTQTTGTVPPEQPSHRQRKIVVLQPRRVAARTLAARVAWERSGKLGDEVGYQIRFDDQTGLGTRICYVTEGILLRWLQDDRNLPEVGAVLFDEFHERNLLSDVALALVKHLQQTRRPDLKMVVMSATLDAEPVAAYLDAAPTLVSEGISHPVQVRYLDQHDDRPVTEQAADVVEGIVNGGEPGDILVFMPGMGEINATLNALRAAPLAERCAFIPLHGDLPPEQQDLAFAPNSLRKVIVATNVAETSVTIDGVRHVVDSGLARIARYDAERGIGTLFIEEVSRASADQRKGRAGRTAPGTCHRLWTESGHLNRPERNTPEIQRSDLAEVVLLLHSLGIKKAVEFDWLDKPDPQAVERAERLLHTLGALSTAGTDASQTQAKALHSSERGNEPGSDLTPIGRQMLHLPMHPRYSRMLIEAVRFNCVPAAALCAALVSGRDLLMRLGRDDKHIAEARELFEASQDSDFYTLMRAWQFARRANFNVEQCRRYGIHAQTARQVEQTYEQILQVAQRQKLVPAADGKGVDRGSEMPGANDQEPRPKAQGSAAEDALPRCLMTGFIDQLCIRRDQGTLECELTEGRQGTLMRESVVQSAPLFVAATIREVTGRGSGNLTLLGLATAVKREWIEATFPDQLATTVEHLFDRTHKRVAAVKLIRFHDLVIHHEHQRDVGAAESGRCLAEAYGKGYFELPQFNHEIRQLIARVNLVCAAMPDLEFPALDDAAVMGCLARAFHGLTMVKEAQAKPLKEAFLAHFAPEQAGWLEELAPTAVPWLEGKKLKLQYSEETTSGKSEAVSPEVQVKLQDCFQLQTHPFVCEGSVPVKFWLCGPDGKRLEATCDWLHFKVHGYPKLKPALRSKYPGVAWL